MKISKRMNPVIVAALFFAVASVSFARPTSADKTTAKGVKKKMTEAAEAIKNYSVDQRNEALKKAKAALDDINARIDRMENRMDEKWGQMDQVARKKMKAGLKELKKQREDLAEWYGGLKYSSGNAWEDVKKGFIKSYHELRKTYTKVRREFQ
jgi:peptidoglycan hydrolase CwlO-like protein